MERQKRSHRVNRWLGHRGVHKDEEEEDVNRAQVLQSSLVVPAPGAFLQLLADWRKRRHRVSWRSGGKGSVQKDEEEEVESSPVPAPDAFSQLLADIEQTLKRSGAAEKVPMSGEVENLAGHLHKRLNEVNLGVQTSKDALNALGTLPWVGAGLTIIAMGLNLALKAHDNKEQCSEIMKESLVIWKQVMKPLLETRGVAPDFMEESMAIIIEGYVYCRDLSSSTALERFSCASGHEKELQSLRNKQISFLQRLNTVMGVKILENLTLAPPRVPKIFATTLVGLEERKRDVLKLLKLDDKEKTRVVVLHGMGGVGKSTLADFVYYKEASSSKERRCCKIQLGETPSKEHISWVQRQLVESLTGKSLHKMERDHEAIADELCEVLESQTGEPVFIYVDNVLERKDLEEFLHLDCEDIKLPNGSRLLVTTRDVSMCTKVFQRNQCFEVNKFKVDVLNERDAEKLFFWHAFGQKEPSAEMVQRYGPDLIEKMVSSVCGKLPLALRVVGRSLFNENVQEWRRKYNDLKNYINIELEEKVSSVLKSSYNALDRETQIAFLMACVCFHDFPFCEFKEVMESLLPRVTITRLTELSLLETHPVDLGEYIDVQIKMHDLVKKLGYQMAIDTKFVPTTVLTCKENFLHLNDEIWSTIKWLRVPPLKDGIAANFLEKCKELEVLVLHTHVIGHVENPPQKLKVVHSTSSLSLEVGELEELVYWHVRDPVKQFPVSSSARLQHLFVFQSPIISEEVVDCHKNTLRVLGWEQTKELSPYFCQKMTKLQQLGLTDFEGDNFPEEIGNMSNLEVLTVTSSSIQRLPQNLALLKKLQCLSLTLENLKEIPSGVLGGMKELKYFSLELKTATCIPMKDISQLASLDVLTLILPSVESVSDDELSLNLEKLKCFYFLCENIRSLEGVKLSCPSLECLLMFCPSLEVMPLKFITGATNLRSVALERCDSLQELSAETEMLWAVESLLIYNCESLGALPEGLMKTVESLAVVECPGVGELPGDVGEEEKARGMRLLLCDVRLLTPQLLALPAVLPYSPGDSWAEQQLESFRRETFYPVSILADYIPI